MKNYTLKILENGKEASKISTHKSREFTTRLRTLIWTESMIACLRVSYGKAMDKQGEISTFFNESLCKTKEELLDMYEYFRHEDFC